MRTLMPLLLIVVAVATFINGVIAFVVGKYELGFQMIVLMIIFVIVAWIWNMATRRIQ